MSRNGPASVPAATGAHPAERALLRGLRDAARAAGTEEEEPDERRRRARKIKPEYSQGPLVKVGRASNLAEVEMIEALLLEQGIPSIGRSSGGLDVPDFYLGGGATSWSPSPAPRRRAETLAPMRPAEPGRRS